MSTKWVGFGACNVNGLLHKKCGGEIPLAAIYMTLPSKGPEFPSAISLDTHTTLTSNLKERVENKEQLNCQFSWKDQFGSVDGCWKDEETKVVKMTP